MALEVYDKKLTFKVIVSKSNIFKILEVLSISDLVDLKIQNMNFDSQKFIVYKPTESNRYMLDTYVPDEFDDIELETKDFWDFIFYLEVNKIYSPMYGLSIIGSTTRLCYTIKEDDSIHLNFDGGKHWTIGIQEYAHDVTRAMYNSNMHMNSHACPMIPSGLFGKMEVVIV